MDRQTALELLGSASSIDRLRAARALAKLAQSNDLPTLREALERETDAWVQGALQRLVGKEPTNVHPHEAERPAEVAEDADQLARDVRAQTTMELTAMVVHELGLTLGSLREAARREDPSGIGEATDLDEAIRGLDSFLGAMRSLHAASGHPAISEFSLSDLVLHAANAVLAERQAQAMTEIRVRLARQDPISAFGDENLVRLAYMNVLRNGIEASDPVNGGRGEPVTVNWGSTDRDAWVTVFDRGVGLPDGAARMGLPGATTKDKSQHSGMGLAITRMALEGLNGTVRHSPREGGGVVCELRWDSGEVTRAGPSD